jgi:hypothetical protein
MHQPQNRPFIIENVNKETLLAQLRLIFSEYGVGGWACVDSPSYSTN